MACEHGIVSQIKQSEAEYMKKMWKKAIGIICAGGLSVMCLAGCGKDAAGSPGVSSQEILQSNLADGTQENNNATDDGTQTNNNAADDGAFLYGANLYGSVVEFSDEGFSLSSAATEKVEGGGEVMAQAAPGSESDEDSIQVIYTDDTVFQIVNLSRSLQTEVSREDTDKESVKKQSSVCVFGSCQDTYLWTADKILILRWQ